MPRWEVCEIKCRDQGQGFAAVTYTLDGEETVIEQVGPSAASEYARLVGARGLRALVARLGRDEWEPFPIVEVRGIGGSTHSDVKW